MTGDGDKGGTEAQTKHSSFSHILSIMGRCGCFFFHLWLTFFLTFLTAVGSGRELALLWAGEGMRWPPEVPSNRNFSMTLIKTLKRCWIWQCQTYPGNVKLELITKTFVNQKALMPLYGHLILGQKPLLPEKCWMKQTNCKTLFAALPAFPYGK